MEVRGDVLLLIVLSALATVVVRVLPFLTAHRLRLSAWAVSWFRFLPPSILASLLLPTLLVPNGVWIASWWSAEMVASFLSASVAMKTRSIMLTIIVGMASYAILLQVVF